MIAVAGVRTWAIIGAGMVGTALSIWRTWIVWKGPWPMERAEQQLEIIGWALWTDQLIDLVIVIALTGLGVAASISKAGVSLSVGEDEYIAGNSAAGFDTNQHAD